MSAAPATAASPVLPALDRVLAAGRATHTGAEAAARAGVDPAWAARVWRAAGFDGAFGDRELSDADVGVLAAAADLVRTGRIDEAELLQLARMFNLAAAPLAEAAALSIRNRSERQAADDGDVLLGELESSLAQFEDVLLHAWRRRLLRVLASGRAEDRRDEAIGFADLAGFTALVTEEDGRWLGVLDRLEAVTFEIVAAHGGRVIKTIGDEVMWSHPDPAAMVATCRAIAAASAVGDLPPLRVGAAWGSTVATRGDRFGPAVNLASRLVRRCRPGEVLLCPVLTAHAADARPSRLPRWLKGIGWLRPGRMRVRTAG